MKKIKDHQQLEYKKKLEMSQKKEKESNNFQEDFKTSLKYLQKMIGEKKKKKGKQLRRRTVRYQNNPNIPTGNLSISTSPSAYEHIHPKTKEPLWGCLKGGTKPTWRQYQKTLKKNHEEKIKMPPLPPPTPQIIERQQKLSRVKKSISNTIHPNPQKKWVSTNRTLKIYKLGKKGDHIGVLIKSGKTRKRVKDEVKILKEKRIAEIKKYLRKHNLIKAGSAAPENVLRKMFEDSYLAGDIYNKNPDTLIHNYIHDQ